MMAPEFKWPGGLELPLLLVCVFGAVVIAFVLAEAVEDGGKHGRADQEAEAGQEERVRGHDQGPGARTGS
ncbi:MAG: hypothetical protein F4Z55_04995 [Boseongicola sp. SB0667_bin_21]|nr:hypothetical protein [Boseongicola sp. SB0667_bin_21]